ncbi:winged helix-turn-helix domain-containing protein [Phenylobacterium sp.]|uniref:winged helix-turn-helix domain-containing protein n=1 Tax=Phenylobacterium sp. TaxID=1871053 RepID=UPI0035B02E96
MPAASEASEGVDLAREADFRLGELEVSPSACRVRGPGGERRVEPRVMQVLIVLVRAAGRTVSRGELIDACWGGRVVSDDAVARAVAQVRALARGPDPAPFQVDTVPKVGFRLTTAGMAAPAEAARQAPKRDGRLWMAVAAGVLLAAGLAGWIAWSVLGRPHHPPGYGRVDVVAFAADAADPDAVKVSDDLSRTLVQVLTSMGVPTGEHPLPRDAGSASELRVTGETARQGDVYVVQSQVIDGRTGLVLLSDRFERPVATLDASAAEIGLALGGVLYCALDDRKAARQPLSLEALGLYLNACDAVFGDDADPRRMLAVTRRLVQAAPRFAGAHAMHGIAAALVANRQEPQASAAALHAEAVAAAHRALELDPRTAKAYSALAINEGALSSRLDQDWLAEERYLLSALKLDPDLPPARHEQAMFLRAVGRLKESLEVMGGMNATGDPRIGPGGDPRTAMLMAVEGDLEGAEAQLRHLEAATRVSQDLMRLTIAFWWEDPKVAIGKLRSLAGGEMTPAELDCMERFLAGVIERQGGPAKGLPEGCAALNRNWRLRMLAREGDVDAVFANIDPPPDGGAVVFYYPEMRAVRADPRFWRLARRIGLVDYWIKTDRWPDFCAEPNLGYSCRAMAAAAAKG